MGPSAAEHFKVWLLSWPSGYQNLPGELAAPQTSGLPAAAPTIWGYRSRPELPAIALVAFAHPQCLSAALAQSLPAPLRKSHWTNHIGGQTEPFWGDEILVSQLGQHCRGRSK